MSADYTKLVIFDCDGTLVDSQHMIVSSMHDTFDRARIDRADDLDVRRIIGLSLEEAIATLKPEMSVAEVDELTAMYKKIFYQKRKLEGFTPDPLFDGTVEAMKELSGRGYILAVATGNSQRGMQRVIDQHDLKDFFVSVQTADFHPSKPNPSMIHKAIADAGSHIDKTVMIGDTKFDTLMAQNAGTSSIGVAWGYHGGQELLDTGASHLIEHYRQLPDLVDGMFNND